MNHIIFLLDALPDPRLLDLDAATVRQTITNGVVIVLLGLLFMWLLYKPVRKFLYDRTERIRTQLEEAKEGRAAASNLRAQYDRQLKDIDIERSAILDEARKQANEQRNVILGMARDEAKELKEQAGAEIALERERIRDELYSALVDISSDMAEKLLSSSIDKNAHDRLFEEGLAELDNAVFMDTKVAMYN